MRCDNSYKSAWRGRENAASGSKTCGPATADDDAKIVEGLPPQVADVVDARGLPRAIVVMTGTEQTFGARVFLQWLALSEANPVSMVVGTVPIKEIND